MKNNNNSNLQAAKNTKFDEFYTTYETIEDELCHYEKHFRNKVVLCNCDDPIDSNFSKYFLFNFKRLGLKRLICTSFAYSSMYTKKNDANGNLIGCVLDIDDKSISEDFQYDTDYELWIKKENLIKSLKGDGDFRSEECVGYLKESDIVVTNPPFSLFKDIVSLVISYNKKFLFIGNQNALTYKEIFPLIIDNMVWTGYKFGDMKFRVPSSTKPRATRYWVDDTGQKWRSLGNAMWLTNLDIERRHQLMDLTESYDPTKHLKYDLFDAINVRTIREIPIDYKGIMGVPITIINKYNSEQFIIVGEANHGSDNEYDLFMPTINGKLLFKRILIKHRMK